jgi:hypothetical protein
MKRLAATLAALGALSISSASWAQDAPAAQPDPVKMDLARQIVAANGGQDQVKLQLKSYFAAMQKGMARYMPAEQGQLSAALFQDLGDEMAGIAPQLFDISVHLYAENLTEKELRDFLAFQTSDSGRSIALKAPVIRQQAVAETIPLVMSLMPQILQKTLDRVCAESHCSAAQRKIVADAMTKAMQRPTS